MGRVYTDEEIEQIRQEAYERALYDALIADELSKGQESRVRSLIRIFVMRAADEAGITLARHVLEQLVTAIIAALLRHFGVHMQEPRGVGALWQKITRRR